MREQEVARHAAEQEGLLDVLLPEVRARRLKKTYLVRTCRGRMLCSRATVNNTHLNRIEQFCDHSRDPAEERRARAALHLVPVPHHLDERPLLLLCVLRDPARVHLAHRRHEHRGRGARRPIGPGDGERGEQLEVVRECARVGREVFVRRELRGVHEDREDGEVILGQRALHCCINTVRSGTGMVRAGARTERQMPVMQRAHRGDVSHRLLLIASLVSPFPVRRYSVEEWYC